MVGVRRGQEISPQGHFGHGHVRIYKSIRQAIGTSIEAVAPQTLHAPDIDHGPALREEVGCFMITFTFQGTLLWPVWQEQPKRVEKIAGSFTATIQQLEQRNAELIDALEQARAHSETLSIKDQEWQEKTRYLEDELAVCKVSISRLEDELNCTRDGIMQAVQDLQECHSPGGGMNP